MTALHPPTSPASRVAAFDRWLTRLRSTVPGELAWLSLLVLAAVLQVSALVPAFTRPELIDFASFVENARAWLAGTPYPGSSRDPNAPHTILLFIPFVGMPLALALALWLAISYGAAAWLVRLTATALAVRPSGQVWMAVACVLAIAPPTLDVITDGNMIWPLALACTAAWIADRAGRSFGAGLMLGALATAKPFVGLWLVYLALRRDRRAVLGFVAGGLVTLAAGIAAAGSATWLDWIDMLDRITWYEFRLNASVLGFLARGPLPPFWPWALSAAAVVVALALGVLRRRHSRDREWLLVLLSALLIAPLGWRYYYWFGIGPLAALLVTGRLRRWQLAALAACFLVVPFEAGGSAASRLSVESLQFWGLLLGWGALLGGEQRPVHASG